ncbi:lipid II flippase MurJ [Actinoplanes sp. NPDC049265]|uniref:lipid II flippase MurJ n=1 Tax=Actinoplanes sp. NPDC049265 TaxID=3363902 RepID=UPI00371DC488
MTATPRVRKTLVQATMITLVVTLSGSLLGFVRDLFLARFFGADGGTDAFLVAWTVPETAFAVVVEGGMSLLMIPLFSRAVSARKVVAATFPPILAVLCLLSALTFLCAPWLVHLIAPGLADPELAVTCTRLTSVTVLTFGITGYVSAALRAGNIFGAPAAIHLAYNIGILTLMWTLHGRLGVVSAAAGVALGSVFMVLVQLPSFLRHVGLPRDWRSRAATVSLAAFLPITVYTLLRQAQVFIERFLGSALAAGTISHLNYAQKVAQIPMLVALLICTVTFPALARTMAEGQAEAARRRLEADLRTVTALIFVAAAYLVVFAPHIVHVLLEHGEFTAADTAATAGIMRVYALGLLGHVLVTALSRPFYAGTGRRWFPAGAMGAGLAVTAVVAVAGVGSFGAYAIAAANGLGISTAAVLLLFGLRSFAPPAKVLGLAVLRLGVAAAGAGAAGWLTGRALAGLPSAVIAVAGGVVVLVGFAGLARLAGVDEATTVVAKLSRRIRSGR